MKRRYVIIGFTLAALVASFILFTTFFTSSVVAARSVSLVITAPEGQQFVGSYVADGVTNSVIAIAPATISLLAKDVSYEFKREAGDGEFRVAVFVGDLCRTSTTSGQQPGVRGELRYAADSESYWAAAF